MTYEQALKGGKIDYWEDMESRYKKLYDEQVAANNASEAASTEQTLREIGEKINEINREYREKNKELYRGYRDAMSHADERMAAAGYTGGASESGRIALRSGYEENRNKLDSQRSRDVTALHAEGIKAENANRAAAEKANAAAAKEYYGYQIATSKAVRSELQTQAAKLAAAGDFSGYTLLGYSDAQIARLRSAWEKQSPRVAMGLAAEEKKYSASQVAALPAQTAQYYLAALGGNVKATGIWDRDTEKAYRNIFGKSSGRY